MPPDSRSRATTNYRNRLAEQGMARFEVVGREADRELIRALARRLAGSGEDAERLRQAVGQGIAGPERPKGGVLDALRRSPLVGAGLAPARPFEPGRKVEL